MLSYFTAPGQARIQIQNGGLTGKEEVFVQNIRRYILKNMTFENEYNFNQHRPKKKMNKLSYYIANENISLRTLNIYRIFLLKVSF